MKRDAFGRGGIGRDMGAARTRVFFLVSPYSLFGQIRGSFAFLLAKDSSNNPDLNRFFYTAILHLPSQDP